MSDLMEGYFCFNGFPCRESRCRMYDKEQKECLFVLSARATIESQPNNKEQMVAAISIPTIEPAKEKKTIGRKKQ